MYRNFSNVISLKLSLFTVLNVVSFFAEIFLLLLEVHLIWKTHEILPVRLIFNTTTKRNKNFENHAVFLPLLSSFKKYFSAVPGIYSCRDIGLKSLVKRVFWIKIEMSFSKLLFGIINNKSTTLFFAFNFFMSDIRQW